ncbi:hypothetical protein QR680_007084 [Steinernema hermaphroditum]|uniref:Uncharacterized protein n=1 Tax=Steinernema hermaphroditum TaxID=289476 RepID=A0AA39HZZ0_9BILA|nr:hypothetical protein QR680_007084 [Steinernema hermaphroditum]
MSSGTGNLHQTTLKSKATSMESITTSIQAANGRTHHRRSGATWTSRASPKLSRSRYGRSYLSLRPATKAFQIVTDRPTVRLGVWKSSSPAIRSCFGGAFDETSNERLHMIHENLKLRGTDAKMRPNGMLPGLMH